MTALNQYQRLEATGRWRETVAAKARDVIVSFGDATLVLSDPGSDLPLAHWSLPAVMRLNPGEQPARYAPGADDGEMVEIEDDLMISAIEKVHHVIESNRPRRTRVRHWVLLLALLGAAVAGLFWLPSALLRHAVDIAPPAQRAEIGQMVLAEIEKTTGSGCSRPSGDMVRRRLAQRLIGPEADIVVLPGTLEAARRLPGPVTVIGQNTIAGPDSPEIAAGHVLAAQAATLDADPLLEALRFAGTRATFELLTKGSLQPAALAGYGEYLLSRPAARPDDEILLGYFARAEISSEPYARALDPTGEAVLGLIEADPFRTQTPKPVLSVREWQALREICDQ
ncbi:hypothetical protein [Paracoccus ravus]|uniref:hypothetical protein n=1 Tax=Paracoccus ravus TaxID=2447760 RepID=UPI00106E65E4|nr:hypothetical protein [Paracoccus ravus]